MSSSAKSENGLYSTELKVHFIDDIANMIDEFCVEPVTLDFMRCSKYIFKGATSWSNTDDSLFENLTLEDIKHETEGGDVILPNPSVYEIMRLGHHKMNGCATCCMNVKWTKGKHRLIVRAVSNDLVMYNGVGILRGSVSNEKARHAAYVGRDQLKDVGWGFYISGTCISHNGKDQQVQMPNIAVGDTYGVEVDLNTKKMNILVNNMVVHSGYVLKDLKDGEAVIPAVTMYQMQLAIIECF